MKNKTASLVLFTEKPNLKSGDFKEIEQQGYSRIIIHVSGELPFQNKTLHCTNALEFHFKNSFKPFYVHSVGILIDDWPVYFTEIKQTFTVPFGDIGFAFPIHPPKFNSITIVPVFTKHKLFDNKIINELLENNGIYKLG